MGVEDGFRSLVGITAEVVSRSDTGRSARYLVRAQGELWTAYSVDTLENGEQVSIVGTKGIGLVVKRTKNGLGIALKLRRHLKTDGLLFLSYLSIYAVGRFIFTFVRQEKIWFWGLQEAQVIAIGIMVVSVVIFIYFSLRARRGMIRPSQTRN